MRKSRFTSLAVVAVLVVACSGATPTPITVVITPGPVVQPTPITVVITPGPVVQPTPQVITITPEPVVTAPPTAEPPVIVPAVPAVPTGYSELDLALGADQPYAGTLVSIQTQWIGGEGANFAATVADFEAATGIDITIEGIQGLHEVTLKARIDGNIPPDLAMLAQPSAVNDYGADGKLVDVSTFMDAAKLQADNPATIGLVTVGDQIWGVPYKVDVKSTIWYPIKGFAAAGYAVPTTWDELIALSDKIVTDGHNPWCVGIQAAAATGWIITDWLEDIMLRTAGVEKYNQWITHELPFDSPEVTRAMELAAQIFFTPDYVYGGPEAITATNQIDATDGMFVGDMLTPDCFMSKQATWLLPDFAPDVKANPGTQSKYILGEDIGLMYFPPIDAPMGNPALGAGDTLLVPAHPDGSEIAPQVKAVAEFLATPEGTQRWIQAGSAISANQNTPADWYAGAYKLAIGADIVANATSFGFDASDLMPKEVGAGAEWTELTAWIDAGGADIPGVLQRIDAAWPTTP